MSDADRGKAAEVAGADDLRLATEVIGAWMTTGSVPKAAAPIADALAAERAAAVADLRTRVEALVEEWDTDHADWCCQRGCPNFHGIHPGDVKFTTEGGIRQIGPDFPCPGECTCYVGPFRDALRAAVTDTTGDPA